MEARLKCESPEKIVYTITITATAKEWEELRDNLNNVFETLVLRNKINNLISQARKIYWTEDE